MSGRGRRLGVRCDFGRGRVTGRRFASGEGGFKLLDKTADDFFRVEFFQPPAVPQPLPAMLALLDGDKLLLQPQLTALEVVFALPQPFPQRLPLLAKLQPLSVEISQGLLQLLPPFIGRFPKLTMELQQRLAGLFHAVAGLLLSRGIGKGGPRLLQRHPLLQQVAAGLFEFLAEGVELGAALIQSAGVRLEQVPLAALFTLELGLTLVERTPFLLETLPRRQQFRIGLPAGVGQLRFPADERGFTLVQQIAEASDVGDPEPQRLLHLLLPHALPLPVPLQVHPLPVEFGSEAVQVVLVKPGAAFEFDGRLFQAAMALVAFGRQPPPLLLQLRLFPLELLGERLLLGRALAVPFVHGLGVRGLVGGELFAVGLQLPAFVGDFGGHGLLEGGACGGEFGLLTGQFLPQFLHIGRALLEPSLFSGELLGGFPEPLVAFLELAHAEAKLPLFVLECGELGVEVLLAAVKFGELRAEVLDEPPRLKEGLLVLDQAGDGSRGGRGEGFAQLRLRRDRDGGARGGVRGAHGTPFPASTVRREGNLVPAFRGEVRRAYSASPRSSAWVELR